MSIEELRRRLDGIDHRLMDLIAERQETIRQIAAEKESTGFPLRDYAREAQVFEGVRAKAAKIGVSPEVAVQLMRILIRYSLTMQEHRSVSAHQKGDGQRALVIGGAGKMGGWFAQFLQSQGFTLEIADPRAASGDGVFADWRQTSLTHDLIVVAAPLETTNTILHELADRRPPGIVFDVGSLKSPILSGLEALRAANVRVTSIHPMFGPDTELLSGRHVIFIDLQAGDAFEKARALFRPTMAEQVVMGLEEHDRLIAFVLGLSHAVNLAFLAAMSGSGESSARLLQLSSTTFDAQFDIARNVAHENPKLYYEIQRLNAFGVDALNALTKAVENLRSSVVDGDEQRFVQLMGSLSEYTDGRRANTRP